MLQTAAIIGDVHGQDGRLAAALDWLGASLPRSHTSATVEWLCTGDLPTKGVGSLARSATLLQENAVLTIRGNHDRWRVMDSTAYQNAFPTADTDNRDAGALPFLRSLPPVVELATSGGPLLLCHGLGRDDMTGIYPGGDDRAVERMLETYGIADRYRYIVCGHTHQRMVRVLFGGAVTIINAGTLLYEKTAPAFAVADFAHNRLQWHDLDLYTNAVTPGNVLEI